MAQGNYGTKSSPLADLYSEQIQLTPRTSDPTSPTQGDWWLRTDLNSGDRLATVQWHDGTTVNEAPVFPVGDSESSVEEVLRVQTPNGLGFVPVANLNDFAVTYPELRLQHGGSLHGWHDAVAALPDSGLVHQWNVSDDSYPMTDSVGSNNLAQGVGGSFVSGATYYDGWAYSTDGTDDYAEGQSYISSAKFSISFFTELGVTGGSSQFVFANGANTASEWPQIREAAGSWSAGIRSAADDFASVSTSASANTLTHIVIRYDGSTLSLVKDTTEADTASASYSQPSGTQPPTVGAIADTGGSPQNFAEIDAFDLGLWYNKSLSDSEIQTIYDAHPST